jgi:hypothetical protein
MGVYGKGLRFRDALSVVDAMLNTPTPTKVAAPAVNPDVFEIGTARAAPGWYPPAFVLTTFCVTEMGVAFGKVPLYTKVTLDPEMADMFEFKNED